MPRLKIELKTNTNRSFLGHRVSANFRQTFPINEDNPIAITQEVKTILDDSGTFSLDFPDTSLLTASNPILLSINSPDGQLIKKVQVNTELIDSARPLVVEVDPKESLVVEKNTNPNFGKPDRIRCYIFDSSKNKVVENLRHFLVRHRLADVQECLLIPLLMSRFDSAKALRWREPLSRYLRDRSLIRGFSALQRIADKYVGSDMPEGSYAEEEIEYLQGYLTIKFSFKRPHDQEDGSYLEVAWLPIAKLLFLNTKEWHQNYLEGQKERDRIFTEELCPKIAEAIVNQLQFTAVLDDESEEILPIDPTLVSDFRNNQPLYVSLNLNDTLKPINRKSIKLIKIAAPIDLGIEKNDDSEEVDLTSLFAAGSKIVVNSGKIEYRTQHLTHNLFNRSQIRNDLAINDNVTIFTPLSRQEQRRPREEDKKYKNLLLKHLNDNLEYYHRAIWWSMDAQHRFMLLDGFVAPNSIGRSVASVVENRLVGIIGNCLVMPVARGYHLDPTFRQDTDEPINLLEHYQPTTPPAPSRFALPTKGVFAESVMGSCNSCEKKDESRFWRWEESPCPDQPTPIVSPSTDSRRSEPPNMQPKDFPSPIVAFQNVPPAPEPQGYGALLQLLSKPNLFKDITGLSENQRNALQALKSSLDSAQFFGSKAAELASKQQSTNNIDKTLQTIERARQAGLITDEEANVYTREAIKAMIGSQNKSIPSDTEESSLDSINKAVAELIAAGEGNKIITSDGRNELAFERVADNRKTAKLKKPKVTLDKIVLELNKLTGKSYSDYNDYFSHLKTVTFLGKEIQHIHSELAEKLKNAETKLREAGLSTSASHWGITSITGGRKKDGNKTKGSRHAWGLAIDINPQSCPYLMHEKNESKLDVQLAPVYHRIANFILGRDSIIPQQLLGGRAAFTNDIATVYDRLEEEHNAMKRYFALMQDTETQLQEYLAGEWQEKHPDSTMPNSEETREQMWQDYMTLGGSTPTGKTALPPVSKDNGKKLADRPFARHNPADGFLNIPKEIVLALTNAGLKWGAVDIPKEPTDLMHFDIRGATIDKKIKKARQNAKKNAKKEIIFEDESSGTLMA
jgi:hypothetical protein